MSQASFYRIGLEGQTPLLWGRFFRPLPAKYQRYGAQDTIGHLELWQKRATARVESSAVLTPLGPHEEATMEYTLRTAGLKDDPYPALTRYGGGLYEAVVALQAYLHEVMGVTYDMRRLWALDSAAPLLQDIRAWQQNHSGQVDLTSDQETEVRNRWREAVTQAESLRIRENEIFGAMVYRGTN